MKDMRNPMANWPDDAKEKLVESDEPEPNNTGGTVRTTRYKDGSSAVHWGGPCGTQNYDANGEEC